MRTESALAAVLFLSVHISRTFESRAPHARFQPRGKPGQRFRGGPQLREPVDDGVPVFWDFTESDEERHHFKKGDGIVAEPPRAAAGLDQDLDGVMGIEGGKPWDHNPRQFSHWLKGHAKGESHGPGDSSTPRSERHTGLNMKDRVAATVLVVANSTDRRIGIRGCVPSGQVGGGMITLTDGVEVSPDECESMVARYLEEAPAPEQAHSDRNLSGGAHNATDGKGAAGPLRGTALKAGAPGRTQKVMNLTVAAQSGRTVLLRWGWEAAGAGKETGVGEWGQLVQMRFDGEELGQEMRFDGEELGQEVQIGGGPGSTLGGALVLEDTRDGNHTLTLRAVCPPPEGKTKDLFGPWSHSVKFEVDGHAGAAAANPPPGVGMDGEQKRGKGKRERYLADSWIRRFSSEAGTPWEMLRSLAAAAAAPNATNSSGNATGDTSGDSKFGIGVLGELMRERQAGEKAGGGGEVVELEVEKAMMLTRMLETHRKRARPLPSFGNGSATTPLGCVEQIAPALYQAVIAGTNARKWGFKEFGDDEGEGPEMNASLVSEDLRSLAEWVDDRETGRLGDGEEGGVGGVSGKDVLLWPLDARGAGDDTTSGMTMRLAGQGWVNSVSSRDPLPPPIPSIPSSIPSSRNGTAGLNGVRGGGVGLGGEGVAREAERQGGAGGAAWVFPMPRGTCDFYMREGKCMLGETCRFRHAGRPQARPLLRAIASILREEEYAVGKGAATNREGKQVSRTGKGEARMLINKLGQRSSGWELAETRVQRLLLSVVGRTKPRAPQRQPPVDWEAWTAEHT